MSAFADEHRVTVPDAQISGLGAGRESQRSFIGISRLFAIIPRPSNTPRFVVMQCNRRW